MLPAPVGVRLDGAWSSRHGDAQHVRLEPDLPVRSFTLAFEGGRPDAALVLTQDLCAEGTDLTMSVKLVAHNGKQSDVRAGAGHARLRPARAGLDPPPRQLATLVARVNAARGGPGVTGVTVKLPKTLRRGKPGATVLAGGRRLQPLRTGRRRVTFPFSGDGCVRRGSSGAACARAASSSEPPRSALSLRDARNHTTALNERVQVRGKRPTRSR